MEERLPLLRAGEACGLLLRREDGLRARFSAEVPRGEGVQKLWLCAQGETEPLLLGTLMPLGGAWKLERTVSVRALRERGLTGALYGEITSGPPPGRAQGEGGPAPPPVRDPLLARLAGELRQGRWQRSGEGWRLSVPWRTGAPFPLAPAFCLARVERGAVCFSFSRTGELLPPPV